MPPRPAYKELPKYRDTEERHSWHVFGPDDQIGTMSLLTPERALRAASAVQTGESFALSWQMELPDPPFFGRQTMRHTLYDISDTHQGSDDVYDNFYSQSSSQWDALNHIGTPDTGMFYNGFSSNAVHLSAEKPLGISNVGSRGITGRYLLLDVARYRSAIGRPVVYEERDEFTADDLDGALELQGVEIEEGDILLLHSGWIAWYERLSHQERIDVSKVSVQFEFKMPGLEVTRRSAEWLWDKGVAAVASDLPGLESGPFRFDSFDGFLHYRLIPLLGLTIGEFFALDALSRACDADRRYDGLLVAAPFNKHGGSGSPANAVAIR
jgi:kynurenine formamidase